MKDFRLYLQEELVSRCRKNPRYSLRSFAKSLGINHGILSLVLRKKRKLTPRMVQTIGSSLRIQSEDLEKFMKLTELEAQGNKRTEKKINFMAIDIFNVISDWYHDAILELSRVKGFKGTPEYISKRLGITQTEARAAIERLERVGLISISENGRWIETLGDNTTVKQLDNTSAALRNMQNQVLKLSQSALHEIPKPLRDHSCITLAIDVRDLAKAKEKIRLFRHEMMAFLQRDGVSLNEVYQMAVSFYPLTQIGKS